jgi:organic radical activating enzyme
MKYKLNDFETYIAEWFSPYLACISPSVPFSLLIDLTNDCNYNCPICYKNKGDKYLEPRVYSQIVNSAMASPRFSKFITLTGGEPFQTYRKYEKPYLAKMIQKGLDNDCCVCLKTNGSWALQKNQDLIWSDLESLDFKSGKLQLDISIDKYHKESDSIARAILNTANLSRKISQNIHIHFINVGFDLENIRNIFSKNNLGANGLELQNPLALNPGATETEHCIINGIKISISYGTKIIKVQNAYKNNIGEPNRKNPLSIIHPIKKGIVLWYDYNNKAHIASRHKPIYTVNYRNSSRGIKSVATVCKALSLQVFKKNKEYFIKSAPGIQNAIPEIDEILTMKNIAPLGKAYTDWECMRQK